MRSNRCEGLWAERKALCILLGKSSRLKKAIYWQIWHFKTYLFFHHESTQAVDLRPSMNEDDILIKYVWRNLYLWNIVKTIVIIIHKRIQLFKRLVAATELIIANIFIIEKILLKKQRLFSSTLQFLQV